MNAELAIETIRQMLTTALLVAAPLLVAGFIIGVVISLIQVATSLQDSAFSTVPRLAAFLIALVISLPWMLNRMIAYTTALFGDFVRYAR